MKKVSALLLVVLCLAICLPACSSDSSWSDVEKNEKLRIGIDVDTAPLAFYIGSEEDGSNDGFEVALLTEIAVGLGLKIEFVHVKTDAVDNALNNKEIDCFVSGFAATAERETQYLLSNKYIENQYIFACIDPTLPVAETLDDVRGYAIAAVTGSASYAAAQSYEGYAAISGKVTEYANREAALNALEQGDAQFIIIDKVYTDHANIGNVNRLYYDKYITFDSDYYAIAVRAGSIALRDKINGMLETLTQNGKAEYLVEQWFGFNEDNQRNIDFLNIK